MRPHITRIMIAPTIAPMKPALSPALYHPTASPRYVATNAPTIPSTVVKIKPLGLILVARVKESRDDPCYKPNYNRPNNTHCALPISWALTVHRGGVIFNDGNRDPGEIDERVIGSPSDVIQIKSAVG
jgi:hypothetical protein